MIAAGLLLGALPFTPFDGTLSQRAMIYNSEALRTAIADGMSRAGAAIAAAEGESPQRRR